LPRNRGSKSRTVWCGKARTDRNAISPDQRTQQKQPLQSKEQGVGVFGEFPLSSPLWLCPKHSSQYGAGWWNHLRQEKLIESQTRERSPRRQGNVRTKRRQKRIQGQESRARPRVCGTDRRWFSQGSEYSTTI
jgi:hypothetical protein